VVIALVASLFAGGLVLCMAFILSGAYGLPPHLGYGAVLAGATLCSLLMGPRDRSGVMITAGLAVVWVLGTAGLYLVRDDVHLRPHEHRKPAAVVSGREPS
jgi:hypothetical protein